MSLSKDNILIVSFSQCKTKRESKIVSLSGRLSLVSIVIRNLVHSLKPKIGHFLKFLLYVGVVRTLYPFCLIKFLSGCFGDRFFPFSVMIV